MQAPHVPHSSGSAHTHYDISSELIQILSGVLESVVVRGVKLTHVLVDLVDERTVNRARASTAFALSFDECTDVSNFKILIVYVRFLHDGQVKEAYLGCTAVQNGSGLAVFNATRELLVTKGFDLSKLVALCSDGAGGMMGKHKGATTRWQGHLRSTLGYDRLLVVHCMAHRLALVLKDAAEETRYARRTFFKFMEQLWLFYEQGAERTGSLERTQREAGVTQPLRVRARNALAAHNGLCPHCFVSPR